jgi:phosphoserine phosphatase RsbU/P
LRIKSPLTTKVLIAEDDPASLLILRTLLEKWGYRVTTATDGADALLKLKEADDLQIIISDWMMPNVDGLELCKLVRSMPNRLYTYFILLTAKSQIEDLVEGMEAGADDFIAKPFNQFELRVRIRAGERTIVLQNELSRKVDELSEASRQMMHDLEAAVAIQMSMLPPKGKKYPGINFSYNFTPCDRIGGDFFNLVALDGNHLGIYICDVSGHGVPAALQSVALARMLSIYDPSASILLKQISCEGEDHIVPPCEVASRLNMGFQFASTRGDFITFLYGVLDCKERTFTYTRAGHPAPVIISREKQVLSIDEGGIPLGIVPDLTYNEQTIKLHKGDRLYFYTDGLTEIADSNSVRFGEEHLRSYLTSAMDQGLENSVDGVVQEAIKMLGQRQRADDLTILGIEVEC